MSLQMERQRMPGLDSALLARLEKSSLPPAVVVGTDVTGLTMARALARHGVPVLGVDSLRRRYTGASGAFHLLLCTEGFRTPAFVEWLEQLATLLPQRPVLFLSMDEHVSIVGEHGQHLRSLYRIDLPTPDAVDLLMNKQRFTAYAREQGWPVPQTLFADTADELEAGLADLPFPVVLKPRIKNSLFRLHSPAKAFHCADAAAAREAYRVVAQWEPEVVVQQWVPGGDSEVWFSFHYLDAALEEIAVFEGRKIRQWVPECGSTSAAVGVPVPRISDLSRTILRQTGCVGLGSVEYKRDPRTDRFYIMEPTVGRANLQVGVAIANGVNTIARGYYHLIGVPYPGTEPVTHDRKWVLLGSDLRSAAYYVRRGELTWRGYAASLRGPREFAVYTRHDPRLIAAAAGDWIIGKPLRLAGRVLRRLRRRSTPASGSQ
jgi:predicted ATP-grasp superfamily ATP-dependent carboligase